MTEKKRWRRGRRPGVKLNEYPPRGPNPNARPGLQRFSVSMPTALARIVRSLKPQLDLEYSKIFRNGLDEVVVRAFREGKISKKTHDQYWAERRMFKDEDW